jgi:hypothetical protein
VCQSLTFLYLDALSYTPSVDSVLFCPNIRHCCLSFRDMLWYIALYCFVSFCTALNYRVFYCCTVLWCAAYIALRYDVVHCAALNYFIWCCTFICFTAVLCYAVLRCVLGRLVNVILFTDNLSGADTFRVQCGESFSRTRVLCNAVQCSAVE